ncbi:RDD family protein [Glacieibacterium megasporae]|uniref:RDD family protein n=1 Tax=Glacieibacterium megasporae TaxID=2835787 RepID=UPI001C1E1BA4|nr:RDD family protein [Polymorphobacter megasporae]UAJ09757.1 RDD family protein [Polymorphobacter megasporae]
MSVRRADDDARALVTPEGVVLTLQLAGTGQRLWAFVLDLAMMTGMLVALTIAALVLAGSLALTLPGGGSVMFQIVGVIWLLAAFVLRNLWFVLFEAGRRTATPGKRIVGLRVAARDGDRLTIDALVARNLVRELEFFLPLSFLAYQAGAGQASAWTALAGIGWTIGFAVLPLFNHDRLRVGDILAGTWVLRAPRRRLGVDVAERGAATAGLIFTDAQLAAYGVFELQTLEDVLRRSEVNPMRRRPDDPVIAVAASIRRKIGFKGGDDFAFLTAYYAALLVRLERQNLFGKTRRDKHEMM